MYPTKRPSSAHDLLVSSLRLDASVCVANCRSNLSWLTYIAIPTRDRNSSAKCWGRGSSSFASIEGVPGEHGVLTNLGGLPLALLYPSNIAHTCLTSGYPVTHVYPAVGAGAIAASPVLVAPPSALLGTAGRTLAGALTTGDGGGGMLRLLASGVRTKSSITGGGMTSSSGSSAASSSMPGTEVAKGCSPRTSGKVLLPRLPSSCQGKVKTCLNSSICSLQSRKNILMDLDTRCSTHCNLFFSVPRLLAFARSLDTFTMHLQSNH